MNMKISMMMVGLVGVVALAACKKEEPAPQPVAQTTSNAAVAPAKLDPQKSIERGKYIVSTAGCHDCHTPWKMGANGPEPDMTRTLSGHPAQMVMPPPPAMEGPWIGAIGATNTAWAGPWGVSFTANLTPDKETGIGTWTKQNFIDTIRNARHMGNGRPLLPPMPAPMYAHLSDEDLGSIFAYLQSLPAISNKVPAPVPPRQQVSAK
jgi:mono/diheme cytochrome c family protein